LFEEVPGLYGSGIIPKQFKQIKATLKLMIMYVNPPKTCVLLPGSAQAEGVCSILRDSHTLSGVERGCLLATAGAGGTAEEPARQQLEPGGELLRLQPPTCVRNPKRAGDNQRATLVTTREPGMGQGG